MPDHERDLLGRRARRRHDQVPFVLPVIIVDDDDDFAGGDTGNDFVDRVKLHVSIAPRKKPQITTPNRLSNGRPGRYMASCARNCAIVSLDKPSSSA